MKDPVEEVLAPAAIERALGIYQQLQKRDPSVILQARKILTRHIHAMVDQGERNDQRLTVGGLVHLKSVERDHAINSDRDAKKAKAEGARTVCGIREIHCLKTKRRIIMKVYLSVVTAALFSLAFSAAWAKDKPSEAFLKKAIEGNYAEVSMGDLAQKNGQSDGIKSFGKMLSTDHSAANQKAMDAAKGMGMNSPTGPNAKQKADYDKMSKMSGAGFDKMFASHMVADHKKDIAEYKKETKMKDAAGEYASGEIDTLQKHLDTAKSLQSGK